MSRAIFYNLVLPIFRISFFFIIGCEDLNRLEGWNKVGRINWFYILGKVLSSIDSKGFLESYLWTSSYLCFPLAILHSVLYFFFLFPSLSFFCTVKAFFTFSSRMWNILLVIRSANIIYSFLTLFVMYSIRLYTLFYLSLTSTTRPS